jgi:hypothetical protein
LSINAMNIFQKLANLTWKKTTFFHCSTQYSRWCSCWMFANYEAFLSYRDISRPQLGWNMIRMGRQFMLRFHIPKKEYCTVYIYKYWDVHHLPHLGVNISLHIHIFTSLHPITMGRFCNSALVTTAELENPPWENPNFFQRNKPPFIKGFSWFSSLPPLISP